MNIKITDNPDKIIKQYIEESKLDGALLNMADDIYKKAKELEPPQPIKDSFAHRMKRIIHGK